MSNKKLLLINAVQDVELSLGTVPIFCFSPTGLDYVAALTPSDWDIKIVDEHVESVTFEEVDLVGITAMTCNAPRAYEISERYRQKGIKTVMGGFHASICYDEAIKFFDSVVIGEAESVWGTVIHDFEHNNLKPFYKGEHIPLDNLIWPKRNQYNLHKYRGNGVYVLTARGCPNNCDFCVAATFYGNKYRQRPVEEVLDELESFSERNFFFLDDNILGYGNKAEQRAIQLFKGMSDRGLKKRWASQVGIDFANNPDVLKWAKKSGCMVVFIGFESINTETLQSMHKGRNLKVGTSHYKDIINRIHDHGIAVHGAFLFGNDEDNKDVFHRTTEFILDAKIDSVQFTVLTPYPGTRLYERLRQEGRLLLTNYPEDWKHYDMVSVTFRPKQMTPDELREGVAQMCLDTSGRLTTLKRAFHSLCQTKCLHVPFFSYIWNRGYGQFAARRLLYPRPETVNMVNLQREDLFVNDSAPLIKS